MALHRKSFMYRLNDHLLRIMWKEFPFLDTSRDWIIIANIY